MVIFDLICGFLLILAGRNLFWLCVGIIGFLIGAQAAGALGYSSGWMELVAAMGLGCVGALLAVCFEWLAVVFGVGFLGGGYLLMNIFFSLTAQAQYAWPVFVVGGIVGMCLMVIVFDWTLIIISSLLGASLIVDAFQGTAALHQLLFVGCMVTGILVQYVTLRGSTNQLQESEPSTVEDHAHVR